MKIYKVKLTLVEPMLGTVAHSKEIYTKFIESKKPQEVKDDESKTVIEREERGWTGFHEDSKGLFIYDYMIKGFLKNAANSLRGEEKGQRQLVDNVVFVTPRRISLGVKKPDGVLERPLRASTMQGVRVTLVRSDTVKAGTVLTFEIHVLDEVKITQKKLCKLLSYGKYKGLGQFRGGSYGQFTYEIKGVENED